MQFNCRQLKYPTSSLAWLITISSRSVKNIRCFNGFETFIVPVCSAVSLSPLSRTVTWFPMLITICDWLIMIFFLSFSSARRQCTNVKRRGMITRREAWKRKKEKTMACDIYFSIHAAPLTGERISSSRCLLSYCKTLSVLLNEVNNLIQEHLTEIIPL